MRDKFFQLCVCVYSITDISMNHQNFNDFDIESSFQEDDNVVINKPFIPAKPSKAVSPPPIRSTFKVIYIFKI